jgi:hypothetical protein
VEVCRDNPEHDQDDALIHKRDRDQDIFRSHKGSHGPSQDHHRDPINTAVMLSPHNGPDRDPDHDPDRSHKRDQDRDHDRDCDPDPDQNRGRTRSRDPNTVGIISGSAATHEPRGTHR